MKTRIIGYFEVEDRIREVILELDRKQIDEKFVLEKAVELSLVLGLCLSQMEAVNATCYSDKDKHQNILKIAKESITYKSNNCTIEEVTTQVRKAYMAFGIQ